MKVYRTQRPLLQAIRPEAELLCRWLPPGELLPNGREGLLTIDGKAYLVGVHVIGGEVAGYRLAQSSGETYDLPVTLDNCECKSFAYHGHRRPLVAGKPAPCKHIAAMRMILAALAAEAAREAVLAEAGDGWDDAETRYQPTAAARAAELVIDLSVQPGPRCTCKSEAEHLARCEPWPGFGDDDFDPAA